MMGARGKEIQINVTLVQDSVYQKLGENFICALWFTLCNAFYLEVAPI